MKGAAPTTGRSWAPWSILSRSRRPAHDWRGAACAISAFGYVPDTARRATCGVGTTRTPCGSHAGARDPVPTTTPPFVCRVTGRYLLLLPRQSSSTRSVASVRIDVRDHGARCWRSTMICWLRHRWLPLPVKLPNTNLASLVVPINDRGQKTTFVFSNNIVTSSGYHEYDAQSRPAHPLQAPWRRPRVVHRGVQSRHLRCTRHQPDVRAGQSFAVSPRLHLRGLHFQTPPPAGRTSWCTASEAASMTSRWTCAPGRPPTADGLARAVGNQRPPAVHPHRLRARLRHAGGGVQGDLQVQRPLRSRS